MKEFYTPREAAADVIGERQEDGELVAKVREYLGGALPSTVLEIGAKAAFLARYVPRATSEDRIFAEQSREDGFVPLWSSYLDDKFTLRNPEKVATVRPVLQLPKGQRTRAWVVDESNRNGGVGTLETIYGDTSAEYQQGLRRIVFGENGDSSIIDNTFDMSAWYRLQATRFGYQEGNLAPFYYPAMLALTTVFGPLYEDFDGGPNAGNGDLKRFTESVVYPAFSKVERDLGVKPTIVQLPYRERMEETNLEFLTAEQAEIVRRRGSQALASGIIETV